MAVFVLALEDDDVRPVFAQDAAAATWREIIRRKQD
jgi:hypothetical protein